MLLLSWFRCFHKKNRKAKKNTKNKNNKERKQKKKKERERINQSEMEKSKGKQKRNTSSLDQTMFEQCAEQSERKIKEKSNSNLVKTWGCEVTAFFSYKPNPCVCSPVPHQTKGKREQKRERPEQSKPNFLPKSDLIKSY